MIAVAEKGTDRDERRVGELAREVHGDLAGEDDAGDARFRLERVERDVEVRGHGLLDDGDGGRAGGRRPHEIAEHLARELEIGLPAGEARIGEDADEGALELSYVALDVLGDELDHFVGPLGKPTEIDQYGHVVGVVHGQDKLRRFQLVQESSTGYSLTLDVSHHKAFWLFGDGGTGKSTFLYVLEHLLGPSALFAAFTGVLLFASSIIAGWVENWFVYYRLDSAIRHNPRFTRTLGRSEIVVSAVGMGCWAIGGPVMAGRPLFFPYKNQFFA